MIQSPQRKTVHFSGQVQGVGFRYTTASIAQGHAVQGFVQNLPDGRVLLIVEGLPQALDGFVAEIRQRLGQYIRQEMTDVSAASGEFTQFSIRHG